MNIIYEQLHNVDLNRRFQVAEYIAVRVCREAAGNTMKHVTAEELLCRPFSLIAFAAESATSQRIVGHVSADGPVVGALWTDEVYRGFGIAKILVREVTEFQLGLGIQPEAFCNPASVGVFAACGYRAVESDRTDRTKMLGPLPTAMLQSSTNTPRQGAMASY